MESTLLWFSDKYTTIKQNFSRFIYDQKAEERVVSSFSTLSEREQQLFMKTTWLSKEDLLAALSLHMKTSSLKLAKFTQTHAIKLADLFAPWYTTDYDIELKEFWKKTQGEDVCFSVDNISRSHIDKSTYKTRPWTITTQFRENVFPWVASNEVLYLALNITGYVYNHAAKKIYDQTPWLGGYKNNSFNAFISYFDKKIWFGSNEKWPSALKWAVYYAILFSLLWKDFSVPLHYRWNYHFGSKKQPQDFLNTTLQWFLHLDIQDNELKYHIDY